MYMFTLVQNRWKIDDVLGVWPLHGLCGLWGGLAAGINELVIFCTARFIPIMSYGYL